MEVFGYVTMVVASIPDDSDDGIRLFNPLGKFRKQY